MSNDTCPACGSEAPATGFRSVVGAREEGGRLPEPTAERATCRCGTPLIRAIGHAWQIDVQKPDGADVQRAIDEGWKRCSDGEFEPNAEHLAGRISQTLASLREGWNPSLIDRSEEIGGDR